MKKILLSSFVGSMCFIGLCSIGYASGKRPLEKWVNFEEHVSSAIPIGDKQSRLVFIREPDAIIGSAVNIFVGGSYLTSLLSGGYQITAVCSHGDRMLAHFSGDKYFPDRNSGVDYNFITGETAYLRVVTDDTGQPAFERVSAEEAEEIMPTLKREAQTLSRFRSNDSCDKAVLRKFTLETQSLFGFDKSDYASMLPEGKKELLELGQKINQDGTDLMSVKVIGYSDSIGGRQYNLLLSERRAETVKKALQEAGISTKIESEGQGKANPVVRNCVEKARSNVTARIACEQPNRRVEIILYGESR